MEINLINPEQIDAAADSLAHAFINDLLFVILEPNIEKRYPCARWMFEKSIKYVRSHGQVFCNEDAKGAALWLPPGETELSTVGMVRAGFLGLPFIIGFKQFKKFMEFNSVVENELHKKSVQGPHWYLMAIGVHPDVQGAGVGSALIKAGTDQADREKLPCYLETGTEKNLEYYTKRGFELTAETVYEGYKGWGMVRKPQ